jgi:hypothetical protein
MNLHKMFAKLVIKRKPNERIFDQIIGYEDIKRLFRMALDSAEPVVTFGEDINKQTVRVKILIECS